MKRTPKTKAELLMEAKLLEEMGGTWTLAHAGAFCNCSANFIVRSDCKKHRRALMGAKGKTVPFLIPAEVRAWNASRTVDRIEDAA